MHEVPGDVLENVAGVLIAPDGGPEVRAVLSSILSCVSMSRRGGDKEGRGEERRREERRYHKEQHHQKCQR